MKPQIISHEFSVQIIIIIIISVGISDHYKKFIRMNMKNLKIFSTH